MCTHTHTTHTHKTSQKWKSKQKKKRKVHKNIIEFVLYWLATECEVYPKGWLIYSSEIPLVKNWFSLCQCTVTIAGGFLVRGRTLCVHLLLSVLGPCLVCMYLCRSYCLLPVSMSSYVHQSWCVQKTCIPWCYPSPLVLRIFLLPLLHNSWALSWRIW